MLLVILFSCNNNIEHHEEANSDLVGTWKLVSATVIQDQDTSITDFTKGQEMIKIINKTHFAFLRHDLNHGKDSTAMYAAGGGSYSVKGNIYTENLVYFNNREWEGNSFDLEYKIVGDTLFTTAVEKIEKLGVNHLNIEKFVRVK
ncbi:hypothetical protein JM658_14545 [Joostella atrarenae]|uniref:Lipocalin-like domain-containing protein n=2 Tax=Joostella atrarenae TaxID=679257 RepID=A0ABS9J6U6_9FLAO|nr:hypothetical protein [Joostella atrarenae]